MDRFIKNNFRHFHLHFSATPPIQTHWSSQQSALFRDFQEKLFSGQVVNNSENRAAWHTEFRNPHPTAEVLQSLKQIESYSESIRKNTHQLNITEVVNIGIGGSDLGPKLVCEAFADCIDGPNVHFVSNLDTSQIQLLLKKLNPKNTLFIIVSKSFRTIETIENMRIAKQWLQENGCDSQKQMIAITHNQSLAIQQYHFLPEQIFAIPEWMGGRFSLWSAVGLICAIAFGFERFYTLHRGAYAMDQHFKQADLFENKIIQYATLLYDQITNQQCSALGILPYTHRLRTLPIYLQQLFMESLGKNKDIDGKTIYYPTGPIVFGGEGTNAQHSFQQLMMQGTHSFVADFILPLTQTHADPRIQAMMAANCITQVKTLRNGTTESHHPHSVTGGKCANLFVLESLDFYHLGLLIAFYEHAVITLAFLLNINPFDQWGVEYAKQQSHYYVEQMGESLLNTNKIESLLSVTPALQV